MIGRRRSSPLSVQKRRNDHACGQEAREAAVCAVMTVLHVSKEEASVEP